MEWLLGTLTGLVATGAGASVAMFIVKRVVSNGRIRQTGWNHGCKMSGVFRSKFGIEEWESIEPALVKVLDVVDDVRVPNSIKFGKMINLVLRDALAVYIGGLIKGLIADNG
jgi:hypothetical protein